MSGWVHGIDVSMHQGPIDWHRVRAAGIRFAWIKTSEGTGYVDPRWYDHRAGAAAAGILWGGYHFARPSGGRADAAAEADTFIRAGGLDGHLPGVLDLETTTVSREATLQWADEFCRRLEAHRPGPHVLYAGAFFLPPALAGDQRLAGCWWWLPNYPGISRMEDAVARLAAGRGPSTNRAPRTWDIWQYSDTGRLPGVAGNVDLNVCSAATFAALTRLPLDPEEPDMPHAVQCPDHTGATVWQPIDGLRRVGYADPEDHAAGEAIAAVGPITTLTGVQAERFLARYFETPPSVVHWGAVHLMNATVERVADRVQGIIDATAGPGELDQDAIRDAIRAAVTEALTGDDPTAPDGLADLIATRTADRIRDRLAE